MEEEIWKTVIYKGKMVDYEASNLGKIRKKTTQVIIKQRINVDGYLTCSIIHTPGKCSQPKVHNLVIEAFKENVNNLPAVNHINSIKSDNRLVNLEYATHSENMTHSYKNPNRKRSTVAIVQYDSAEKKNIINTFNRAKDASDKLGITEEAVKSYLLGYRKSNRYFFGYADTSVYLTQEELVDFVPIKNFPRYLIHRDSRIYSKFHNRLLKPAKKGGYLNVFLGVNNQYKVHRLVAMQFIDNPENKKNVNHKDGNKLNNHVDNLEWVTLSENNQHAMDTGLNPCTISVKQYTLKGEFVKEFNSSEEALRSIGGKSGQSILKCCRGQQKHAYKFIWRFATDESPLEPVTFTAGIKLPVLQFTEDGKFIKEHACYGYAAKEIFGCKSSRKQIAECCNGKRESFNGFRFQNKY